MEIERKFLIDTMPVLASDAVSHRILQGYLPGAAGDFEVRLRRRDHGHWLTVKKGSGLVRDEVEIELTADQFQQLWPLTEGRRLEKTRHLVPWGAHTVELDLYEADLEGLIVAEVEFESEDAAAGFQPPEWFGREITADKRFKNRQLARLGLPDG